MNVQISVDLSKEQYRAMTAIADKRHTQVRALIEQLVSHALQPKPIPRISKTDTERTQLQTNIRSLHATGRNDRQIAENLGVKRSRVSYFRALMDLPSNSPQGRKKSTPNQIESTTA